MTQAFIHGLPQDDGPHTSWGQYNLDDLWEMVKTEDSRVTHIQIDAWRRLAEVCNDQSKALQDALGQLAERWPPTPGSASAAFAIQVMAFVQSMRQAAAAGEANQEPLTKITTELTDARIEIAALRETRRTYMLVEQKWSGPIAMTHPGEAPPDLPPAPPTNWRAQLDSQARSIMARADTIVGLEAAQIQQPEPFEVRAKVDDKGPRPEPPNPPRGSSDNTTVQAENLRPVTGNATSAAVFGGSRDLEAGGFGAATEPVLSGANARPEAPPHGGPALSGPVPDPLMRTAGMSPSIVPFGGVLVPPRANDRAATPTSEAGVLRPRSISGVSTNGALGHPMTSGAASALTGHSGMPMAPMVPPQARQSGTPSTSPGGRLGRSNRNRRSTDPDDPWAVAEGGPAVLEPSPEPRNFDPGPGVIGLPE